MPVDVHIAHIPSAARLYGAFLLAVLCVLLWLLLGDAFLPRGAGFSLLVLYLASTACGALVQRLSSRLPPLLGMLLAGLVLRNLPGEPLRSDHALLGHAFAWWSNKLRACALATIMLRAGLGLDLAKLRRMGLATARLAFCPCLAEALTVALLAAALLSMPPAWGAHGMLKVLARLPSASRNVAAAAAATAAAAISHTSAQRCKVGCTAGAPPWRCVLLPLAAPAAWDARCRVCPATQAPVAARGAATRQRQRSPSRRPGGTLGFVIAAVSPAVVVPGMLDLQALTPTLRLSLSLRLS